MRHWPPIPSFDGRVVPTFRPDRYLEPGRPGFAQLMDRLAEASGEDTGDFPGYLRALAQRRRHFKEHGAVSADHSHADVVTLELAPSEAARIYAAALRGETSTEESTALRRHMMVEMAQMSVDDGLVMTLHPGVHRNHHSPTLKEFGPDTGHDIPVAVEFTRSLQPLLDRFGTAPELHLVLFTVDETVFSREIAPLAGFYPAVYAGVPWWFLDAPEAIRRYRGAVTRDAGLLPDLGLHRRHPRLLLDPRAARHVPPPRQRLPRRARRAAPARRGRGVRDRHRPRDDDPASGVQAVSQRSPPPAT